MKPLRGLSELRAIFAGYDKDPKVLSKVFEEVEGYDEMVIVQDIRVVSCEHHMVPILERLMLDLPNKELWASVNWQESLICWERL